jgi:uncharacterized protein
MGIEPFVNRVREMRLLGALRRKGGLAIVFGRRRVGKTRLIRQWMKKITGAYSQAIEGSKEIQLDQVLEDIRPHLPGDIRPTSWTELFSLLELSRGPWTLCLDEFPYLVAADPSLPSIIQKWWDHKKKMNISLILCGSSQRMMHRVCLDPAAPLYGRSRVILPIKPMAYGDFCKARGLDKRRAASFVIFSLVGGVPKYWEFVHARSSPLEVAQELFFGFAAYMENEPRRLLMDEQISGLSSLSVLEAIGRGAERPSEIASRQNVPQTQLSKVFYQLMDADLVRREVPFGQSERNPKNVLYKISDPSLRFWFKVFSPHQSRWPLYSVEQKEKLLFEHASTVFEDQCRALHPHAKRYWGKNVEIDIVRPSSESGNSLRIAEVKFRKLSEHERHSLLHNLEIRWKATKLAAVSKTVDFEILDTSALPKL